MTRRDLGRPLRVLQVVPNLAYGGMERLVAELAARVDRARFEPHVLVLGDLGRFGHGLEARARVHQLRPQSGWSMIWPSSMIAAMRVIRPDVVHSHSGVWYKASLAACRAGVPLVVHTDHGRPTSDPWPRRRLERLAAGRTNVVVAVSAPLAERLASTVVRDSAPIITILNGVDTAVYRPRPDDGAIRRELGLGAEVPLLGSIGRLEPIKGYDVMVEALARLCREWSGGPAPVLVVAGGGSALERLRELTRALCLGDRVRWLGWRDDVEALHAAFTLFTMSSRSEGTSVSLLEAMSAGLCPVVTAVGGNAEVLGPDLAHRLVPPENPGALAAAWRDALTSPIRRQDDAQAARCRVEACFGLDAMVRCYERLYAATPRTHTTPHG